MFRLLGDDKTAQSAPQPIACQRLSPPRRQEEAQVVKNELQLVSNVIKRCFYSTQPGKQAPALTISWFLVTQKALVPGVKSQRGLTSEPPVVKIISE